MTSSNIDYLRRNGPSTLDELPNNKVSTEDRMMGVWKFTIVGAGDNGSSSNYSTGGHITPVYYLEEEHDRQAVVGKFLNENPRLVEKKPRKGLRQMLRKQGRQWHDAIDAVFPANPPAENPVERLPEGTMKWSIYEWFREHGPAKVNDALDDLDTVDEVTTKSSAQSSMSRLKKEGYLEVVETVSVETGQEAYVLDAVEFDTEDNQ